MLPRINWMREKFCKHPSTNEEHDFEQDQASAGKSHEQIHKQCSHNQVWMYIVSSVCLLSRHQTVRQQATQQFGCGCGLICQHDGTVHADKLSCRLSRRFLVRPLPDYEICCRHQKLLLLNVCRGRTESRR